MGRKSKEELNKIKKDYNVSELWSWSRYNLSHTDMYSYYLKYILRKKEDRADSIYGILGSLVHDLLEKFYLNKITKEEMLNIYNDKVFEFEIGGYRFNRNDEIANDKIATKYHDCVRHYIRNFTPITDNKNVANLELEKFLLIKVSKFLFQGYSDCTHNEIIDKDNKRIITDFKTSTIYTGKKIAKESGQLLLYSLYEIQHGVDIENIIARWDFLKYVNVQVPTKDGFRVRNIERNQIGSKLKASISSALKKQMRFTEKECNNIVDEYIKNENMDLFPSDIQGDIIINGLDEIQRTAKGAVKKTYINKFIKHLSKVCLYNEEYRDELVEEMILTNSIEHMPKSIKDIFIIDNCYVEIDITKESIKNLQVEIITKIVDIIKKTKEYNKTKDDNIFYEEVTRENEYFHACLSGYSSNIHKPYRDYIESQKKFKNKDNDIESDDKDLNINEILDELGLDL